MYDIFISYRRDGGHEMARLLYEHFKNMGYDTFFDFEELKSGHFDKNLYKFIEESKNFLLVLPANALERCENENDWLRLEIEHAILHKKNIIPVMMADFSWPKTLPSSMLTLPTYNGVHMSREYFDASIMRIVSMLTEVELNRKGEDKKQDTTYERIENKYFDFEDEKEKKRLKIQQDLMKSFDSDTYKKVIDEFDELYILDVGSNNGDFIMDRIGKSEKVRLLVGLEFDAKSVEAANKKYGEDGRIAFYEQNVENEDIQEKLSEIIEKTGIERFNVINISMLLLHLKTPFRLLRALRKFLVKGGVIIIKDIDDGYNLAYPDDNGDFARVVDICTRDTLAGYRHSGRQIYTLLKHAGYTDVSLEKAGLSTIGMDYDERSALFDTYFSFILEDLKIILNKNPGNTQLCEDYEWYKKNYEDLEESFLNDDFFFNLGFVIYTARKR